MRAFVFTDKALERYAGQFVWLAVDTENSANASFLTKYPINVWPTMMIVDPKKESVALRYAGGATVPQLTKLLDDGAKVVRGAQSKADEALTRGDRLANEKKTAEAAAAYEEAIKAATKNWSRFGRAAESLTFTVLCLVENGFMTIGVIDSVSQKLPYRVKATDDDAHGRGLALIETLAADVGCEPCAAGKMVFARLYVTEPPIHVYLRELAGTGQQCFT